MTRESNTFWGFVDETRDRVSDSIGDIMWAGAGIGAFGSLAVYKAVDNIFPGEASLICTGFVIIPLVAGGVKLVGNSNRILPTQLTRLARELRDRGMDIVATQSITPSVPTPEPAAVAATTAQYEAITLKDSIRLFKGVPHSIVLGPTGTGKSTFMHAIGVELAKKSKVYVIDPDYSMGSWPKCTVKGAADNWNEVETFLGWLKEQVSVRRNLYHVGVREFDELFVVIDELKSVLENSSKSFDMLDDILRRGRKIKVHVIAGTQDMQVASLGIQGKGKLRDNFGYVFTLKNDAGVRTFKVEHGDDRKNFVHYMTPNVRSIDSYVTTISMEEGMRRIGKQGGANGVKRNGANQMLRAVPERNPQTLEQDEGNAPRFALPKKSGIELGKGELPMGKVFEIMQSYLAGTLNDSVSISAICIEVFGSKNAPRMAAVKKVLESLGHRGD